MRRRIAVSFMLAGLLTYCAGTSAIKLDTLDDQTTTLSAQTADTQRELATARISGALADARLAGARSALTHQEAALAERPAFMKQVAAAKAAIGKASGKVDAGPYKKRVLAGQKAFTGAGTEAAAKKQTSAVAAAVKDLNAAVAAHDAEQARRAAEAAARQRSYGGGGGGGSSGGFDLFADARAHLNAAGGGGYGLKVVHGGSCGSVTYYLACAEYGGTIVVNSVYWPSQSVGYRAYTMRHEVAHMAQYRVWSQIHASASYGSLFGNVEVLADCMVRARWGGSTNHGCSAKQVSWAGNIWNGVVPG